MRSGVWSLVEALGIWITARPYKILGQHVETNKRRLQDLHVCGLGYAVNVKLPMRRKALGKPPYSARFLVGRWRLGVIARSCPCPETFVEWVIITNCMFYYIQFRCSASGNAFAHSSRGSDFDPWWRHWVFELLCNLIKHSNSTWKLSSEIFKISRVRPSVSR